MSERLCAEWEPVIHEWLDAGAVPAAPNDLAKHLAVCDHCRRVAEDLGQIRHAVQGLGPLEPPASIWNGVSQAITQTLPAQGRPVAEQKFSGRRAELQMPGWSRWFGLVAAGAAAVWFLTVSPDRLPQDTTNVPAFSAMLSQVSVDLDAATQEYEHAQTVATDESDVQKVLREHLLLIDAALVESQDALDAEPGSEVAQRSLIEGARQKAAVLRLASSLVTAMWTDAIASGEQSPELNPGITEQR